MKLTDLLEKLPHTLVQGGTDIEITALEYDSRKAVPGSLFLCITGFHSDGHDFIPAALEKGAAALVVEREVEVPADVTVIRVEDSRYALALLSAAWFGHPAESMTVIGLTGTKGKTTTAHMIKSILEAAGHKVGMVGTLGAYIGGERLPTKNTTPESYELHSYFARMRDAGCTHVVMEASSQGFKLRRTAGIRFDYGVFLNISPDHIGPGEHADFEEYLQCKGMLLQQSKMGVVNRDDPHASQVMAGASCPVALLSTKGTKADFFAYDIREKREAGFLGASFQAGGRFSGQLELNMPGRFNVENALAAVAVTSLAGVSPEAVAAGLRRVAVKGRTQVLDTPGHYTVLIDYAHNAVSTERLLSMLRAYHPTRLICLFGCGGDRPRMRRYDMGEISAKYADLSVLTSDNPRSESPAAIIEDIKVGVARHNGNYVAIVDRREAIHWVLDHAQEGDIIAMIGKGHEEYVEIQGVRYPFSEEQVVAEYFGK